MTDEIDWTPRKLPGGVYCSRACGIGCKRKDYDQAVASAAKLAARMGVGWLPHVWENLGWHYEVTKGVASIHPPGGRVTTYSIYFNTIPQIVLNAETPEDAAGFAVQRARGNALRIAADSAALLE
ncbi:hypothetical protein LCGC14_1564420 [marine sediment metagenome]|uniref:Uncharacterized protein n=1 Tax=marine sediment metagenome TaxID=412755 RepID=A0A0F9J7P4_9ZZZZ